MFVHEDGLEKTRSEVQRRTALFDNWVFPSRKRIKKRDSCGGGALESSKRGLATLAPLLH